MTDERREITADVLNFEHEMQTHGLDTEHQQAMQRLADQNLPESVQLIMRKAEPVGIELPSDIPSLWQYAVRELTDSAVSKAKAGLALLALKERTEHGSFLQQLKHRQIAHSTANDAMNTAKVLLKIPESKQKLFVGLGSTKLNLLARLPDEIIEEMAETESFDGQPIDEIKLKSARELQEEIRQMRDKHERETKALRAQNDLLIKQKAQIEAENETLKGVQQTEDEAEKAALIRFARAKEMVCTAVSIITGADLREASPRVKLDAAFVADFIEAHGRHAAVLLRRTYPECWEGSGYIPDDRECEEAQAGLTRAAAKLRHLRDDDLK